MKGFVKGKFLGAVTVGERGQVVIPAEIRRSFKVKSGDKLVVFSKSDMFGFVRADDFNQYLDRAAELMSKLKNDDSKKG